MRYEPATRTRPTATGCQPGTRALADALRAVWPELATLTGPYGCFNSRLMASSSTWSLHAEGRALDVGVTPQWHAEAWSVVCELVARRVLFGTMRIMWDGHIWSTERRDEYQKLGPHTNPHRDHFHVEQFWSTAMRPRAEAYPEMRDALASHRERLRVEA